MPVSIAFIRELENIDPKLRHVLLKMLEELERQREECVTKKEFNELKAIVKELAEAQRNTEQRLSELAEAQKKTEQRLSELAEAQKKTEQRLNALAEAQKKTEQRLDTLTEKVNELAEAQKKTEQRLNELAEAQKKTEQELKKLIGEHRKTREQLGGLAHTVGYLLEDRAFIGLPPLLEREKGIRLISPLKRDYIEIAPGRYVEINIIGKAERNGHEIWIIGECKTQLKKKDVDKFLKTLNEIKELLGQEVFPVLVTYQAPPQVQRYVKEKGLDLYFSYQFPSL